MLRWQSPMLDAGIPETPGAVAVRMQVREAQDFVHAVAGIEMDLVRADAGFGPAAMTYAGDDDVVASVGGLDFSVLAHSEIPRGRMLIHGFPVRPEGLRIGDVRPRAGEPLVHGPGAFVTARLSAGVRATTLVVRTEALESVAEHLRLGDLDLSEDSRPLRPPSGAGELGDDLDRLFADPGLLTTPTATTRLLEDIARTLQSGGSPDSRPPRRLDRRAIVRACIDFVESTSTHQPTMSDLCGAAAASESTVREAFVEVFGMAPTRYFGVRVLSLLRDRLLTAHPEEDTVTGVATSLGLTQLGRVAGRYRALYGENPSDTLRQTGRQSGSSSPWTTVRL
jgi:AraC-like DNA-binding protein